MVTKIQSVGLFGMTAFTIEVEADLATGIPKFDIVGLPDMAVKESRDRVCSAIKNCGYEFPVGKITINLAPADIKKTGPIYDVAMLIALLQATSQLNVDLSDSVSLGELSLSGDVRVINGVLPMAIHAKEQGFRNIFVPKENALEASVVEGINVYAISHIKELIGFLTEAIELVPEKAVIDFAWQSAFAPDFSEVKGQHSARRALEIAAAGGHNGLLLGYIIIYTNIFLRAYKEMVQYER